MFGSFPVQMEITVGNDYNIEDNDFSNSLI